MFEGIEALNAAARADDMHAEATEAKQQKDVEVSEWAGRWVVGW